MPIISNLGSLASSAAVAMRATATNLPATLRSNIASTAAGRFYHSWAADLMQRQSTHTQRKTLLAERAKSLAEQQKMQALKSSYAELKCLAADLRTMSKMTNPSLLATHYTQAYSSGGIIRATCEHLDTIAKNSTPNSRTRNLSLFYLNNTNQIGISLKDVVKSPSGASIRSKLAQQSSNVYNAAQRHSHSHLGMQQRLKNLAVAIDATLQSMDMDGMANQNAINRPSHQNAINQP